MKHLLIRTLTGAIYVGIILASILIHPFVFALLTTLIAFLAMRELRQILFQNTVPEYWLYLVGIFFFIAVLLIYLHSDRLITLTPLLLILIMSQIGTLYMNSGHWKDSIVNTSFTLLYIILPLYLMNLIHHISITKEIPYTLAVFIFIWTNDTFAYLTGLAFGRHKLFERISPKKTWEGFVGGMVLTLAASYLMYSFYPSVGLLQWLFFGLLTSIAAVYGDFIESMLKRSGNIKDSGTLLPGHGGMLDRIDSLLLASPVIYGYIILILK